jgi:uncharacterized protein (TIGR03083 family)
MRHSDKIDRIAVLAAEQKAVLEYGRTLSAAEWARPSNCAGWTVKDVVAHMAAAYHGPFQPSWIRRFVTAEVGEQIAEVDVAARRHLDPAQVLAEYERWGRRFLRVQRALYRFPRLAWSIRLGAADLGTYPIGSLVSAFVFDHHTHLRHDIAPVVGRSAVPPDPNCLTVTMEWMLTGLEQMCRQQMTWVDRPLTLVLDGPGGGVWSIEQAGGGMLAIGDGGAPRSAATITGVTEEFPLWGTTRRPWRDCAVVISGDREYATRFLDAMNII